MCSPYPVGLLRSGAVGAAGLWRLACCLDTRRAHSPGIPPGRFSQRCPLLFSSQKPAVLLDLSGRSAEI
jgi:hypothetical protein